LVQFPVGKFFSKDRATRLEIYSAAFEGGLKFCPPWSGAALSALCSEEDLPRGKCFIVGIDPLLDEENCPRLLRAARLENGVLVLGTDFGMDDFLWDNGTVFIFSI